MNTQSDTACERCRKQKLRCSRDFPQCARCAKFGILTCDYPPLPDRKALAQHRNRPKPRSVARQKPPRIENSQVPLFQCSDTTLRTGGPAGCPSLADGITEPSSKMRDFLLDTYFSCQFHSSLLFHRPTFDKALEAGHEARHTLWALYASATIFLPEKSKLFETNADLLCSYGDLRLLGNQYALAAGREALQAIDRPTFTGVRICECLSLYWFSQGDAQRHAMFLSIAHKAASILGLDADGCDSCFEHESQTYLALPQWLKKELARRCFWAISFTQCISSDHSLPEMKPNSRFMSLPLPMNEDKYIQLLHDQTCELLSISGMLSSAAPPDSRDSVYAELVMAIHFWAKVRMFLDARVQTSMSEWLPELYKLDHQITLWYSSIPECFVYTKKRLYEQRLQTLPSIFLFIHTVYHQCRLVLHSSLVPQFSGLHLPKSSSPEIVDVAARIAIRSAQDISTIATDLVALDWDPAYLPAFLGYAWYSAATIHLAMLRSKDEALKRRAKTSLRTNVRWLRSLKLYWSNLDRLWMRINVLYEAQVLRLPQSTTHNATANSGTSIMKDLDQLAHEVRDAGQLTEPLADSMLEYSLRRLRPAEPFTSEAIKDLEEGVDLDQLNAFIEENAPNDPRPLMGGNLALQGESVVSTASNLPSLSGTYPITADTAPIPVQDWMAMPWSDDDELYPTDWYGLGTDLLQPILPFENMLMDFGGTV